MKRCNCPRYNIPSADPNDSIGCPVHDPNYVDPQDEIRRLRVELEQAVAQKGSRQLACSCGVESTTYSDHDGTCPIFLGFDPALGDRDRTLCANCTPEKDHNGVRCRSCANEEIVRLRNGIAHSYQAGFDAGVRWALSERDGDPDHF